ncbi:hypothetical protein ACJ3XI_05680 [Litorimonas sp. RW-G-Af-16]|uniref:hypothetical protein n=1 Tax=Litorimonas sp. RW-G-Af-16 TaxID=3241168 RepID=UPI00390C89F1
MKVFRLFLIVVLIAIISYTFVTISRHGLGLIPIFFGDMAAMTWPGQFNFDFMCFLFLSGIWTAWRNKFSISGLILALFAFFGGMLFLSAYLLYLSFETKGDIKRMMLGDR